MQAGAQPLRPSRGGVSVGPARRPLALLEETPSANPLHSQRAFLLGAQALSWLPPAPVGQEGLSEARGRSSPPSVSLPLKTEPREVTTVAPLGVRTAGPCPLWDLAGRDSEHQKVRHAQQLGGRSMGANVPGRCREKPSPP